ncbi:hypothetical protein PTSG_11081 [Salpingoeca rosetta]|uniref:Glycolipid transfer protein domain-containing protein n=1 Tax=Salpingoeca rosetta (strain ATCC 50818 / BSB-021) TaxID=946362 RepID=F2US31_SALR5|nr:uncharacterized protein PTSG_11081 [Salpingoeca rosetta]EGD80436.1 hypothetical protein PTSG_11081 [Salpingoeca rosetta]|eukprot:XP_004988000.1 hypothetical protein PTSG_11081 [Salpingoeca rosetta]
MTFFTTRKVDFAAALQDAEESDQKILLTTAFVDSAEEILPIFDALGSTAFAPVKSDISGNIKKLRGWHAKDTENTQTLQALVQKEIDAGTTKASGSATDALLWLKRALNFINAFLDEVLKGESPSKAASTAYTATLSRYHNFFVRQIFNVAMKVCPSRENFLKLLRREADASDDDLLEQMRVYNTALSANLHALQAFYDKHGLDA